MSRSFRRSLAAATLAVAAVALAMPAGADPGAGAAAPGAAPAVRRSPGSLVDVRRPVASARSRAIAEADARGDLGSDLGRRGVFDLDPRTGTVRTVGRLDGTLTGPSGAPAPTIAMRWVRTYAPALGLDARDFATFELARDVVDIDGTHHLAWVQRVDGIEAFDNGLLASVTADGRLITVSGSPAHGLGRGAAAAPTIGRERAIAEARAASGTRADAGPAAHATLVYFHGGRSTLAWETETETPLGGSDLTVVDATTGGVLWHASQSRDATGTASAWGYFPSSKVPGGGNTQQPVTFPVNGGGKLLGNNAHVFVDAKADGRADPGDEVPAISGLDWSVAADLDTTTSRQNCTPVHPCSWDKTVPQSWKANRTQNAAQVYYFVNAFHDHLLAAPIGFNEANGNFETHNATGKGKGHDAVKVHVFFGASTAAGLPAHRFTNNASMGTPPDGRAPTLVLLLFAKDRLSPTFPSSNAGDDASVVYHEYTHGLSSRLVTYPSGRQALNTAQAGAMGEAWSDWYALDLLVQQGFITDTAADGEVMEGKWITGGPGIRYQSIDCSVGAAGADCPRATATGPGGFTYADFGRVFRGPEVHSDGEIWAQTLWDLRAAVGVNTSERLVTRAMQLSPPEPSFLDMRNAILQADVVASSGAHRTAIWNVFRHRGMGYFASTVGSDDVTPVADGHAPPSCKTGDCGSIRGRLRERVTGAPLANVRVSIGGHDTGFPGTDLTGRTDRSGRFAIRHVPFHTYADVVIDRAGIEPVVLHHVRVNGVERIDRRLYHDWAALDDGATIQSFTRPDYTPFGCGPRGAFDRSLLSGWSSDAPGSTYGSPVTGPRSIVVALSKRVDVTSFGLDPAATCGDGPDAAVLRFDIYTRTGARTPWRLAVHRTTKLPQGVITTLRPTGSTQRTRFVKLTMRSTRGSRVFMDMTELSVRGRAS